MRILAMLLFVLLAAALAEIFARNDKGGSI